MITLADAKAFCRVDHDDDDAVITAMLAAAGDYLAKIGVDTQTAPVPPAVEQAMLMLTAFFYDHREDVDAEPAGMIDRLCAPYREVSL